MALSWSHLAVYFMYLQHGVHVHALHVQGVQLQVLSHTSSCTWQCSGSKDKNVLSRDTGVSFLKLDDPKLLTVVMARAFCPQVGPNRTIVWLAEFALIFVHTWAHCPLSPSSPCPPCQICLSKPQKMLAWQGSQGKQWLNGPEKFGPWGFDLGFNCSINK